LEKGGGLGEAFERRKRPIQTFRTNGQRVIFDVDKVQFWGVGVKLFLKKDIATMTRIILCRGGPLFSLGWLSTNHKGGALYRAMGSMMASIVLPLDQ